MKAATTESNINERMPVWMALSEFFLDTTLDEKDIDRIANILAASPYSEQKIEEILHFEIYPVCKWNLFDIAGEWAGFDEQWIREKVSRRYDKRPFFNFGIWNGAIFRKPWKAVRQKIKAIRQK